MIALTVGCDQCLCEQRCYGAESATQARDILSDDGWEFEDGLELCPACKVLPRPQVVEMAGCF